MYSLVTTTPDGQDTYQTFESERTLFLHLESIGVTYYSELGYTRLANGNMYEYGQVGK